VTHSTNETLRNVAALGSFRFDVGCADHLGPLLGFLGEELGEIGRSARKRYSAQIGKPGFESRIGEAGIGLPVELIDDFGWAWFGVVASGIDWPSPGMLVAYQITS